MQNNIKPNGFQHYQGRFFSLDAPSDFKVTTESDSGIDLTNLTGNAGFSYTYVTGMTGAYTPLTWAQKAIPEYAHIYNFQLGNPVMLSSQIPGQSLGEMEFSGFLNGNIPVKGKITVGIISAGILSGGLMILGPQYSSAFWATQVSTPEFWPAIAPVLRVIQDSMQITDIGPTRRNTMLPPNRPIETVGASAVNAHRSPKSSRSYQDEVSDKVSQDWAESMSGYETVTSPTTGQNYDVTLDSWSYTGVYGPGYYRTMPDGSYEKLQQN